MLNYSNAVKAFIVKNNKLLLLKRRPNDTHSAGKWDIPGGRLNAGESPYDGLNRECHEEIGNEVEIIMPLDVQHFKRQDGQQITMIIFLCHLSGGIITLSEEHTEYTWKPIDSALESFDPWLQGVVSKFLNLKPAIK